MLNKLHPLSRYKANSGKNNEKMLMHFFSNLYLFDSIFSVIVWTNRLHDFDEGICFPDTCCYVVKWVKDNFTVIIVTVAKRKRCFIG